ncbi:U3-containing 90S pre-ribosomal complex subunit-domain containing protein [Cunninghamella echinulata]|nr:U3-containing 90S pre-ribosomal complex subunit-domain containing protein [Cunninghamella echinulata]
MAKKENTVSADAFEDDFVEEDIYSDSNEIEDNDEVDNDKEINQEKRKRSEVEEQVDKTKVDEETAPKKKQKKNNNKKKAKKSNDIYQDMKIWTESPTIQAEYLLDRMKKALPTLTDLEIVPVLPESLVDNSKFKQEHTIDNLSNYVKFGVLRHKQLAKKPTTLASPRVLVITHAALRAADLGRGLKEFAEVARIAKLFAKHFKMSEQVEFLKSTPIHLAVGTPNRISALVDNGHLKLDQLELVVLDTDTSKGNYNITENFEVRGDLFKFLNGFVFPRMKDGQSKLGFF